MLKKISMLVLSLATMTYPSLQTKKPETQLAVAPFQNPFTEASSESAIRTWEGERHEDMEGVYYDTHSNEDQVSSIAKRELNNHLERVDGDINAWAARGLETRDNTGRTCFLFAVCESDLKGIKTLLNLNANTHAEDGNGRDAQALLSMRVAFWQNNNFYGKKFIINRSLAIQSFLQRLIEYKSKCTEALTCFPKEVSGLVALFAVETVEEQKANAPSSCVIS